MCIYNFVIKEQDGDFDGGILTSEEMDVGLLTVWNPIVNNFVMACLTLMEE